MKSHSRLMTFPTLAILTLAILTLAIGCGGTDDAAAGTAKSTTSVSGDGVVVTIPAGAAPAGAVLAVGKSTKSVAKTPTWANSAGDTYAFTPHGTKFAQPITVKLPYAGPGDIVLRLADETDTTWEVVDGATFAGGVATFQTKTFSLYIVASRCQKLCEQGLSVCGAATKATNGDCTSACQGTKTVPSSACQKDAEELYNCYLANQDPSQFLCATTALPAANNCAAIVAKMATCQAGGTAAGADAGATGDASAATDAGSSDTVAAGASDATDAGTSDTTDAGSSDAVAAVDAGTADGATLPDTTAGASCPCFDTASIDAAYTKASTTAGWKVGVSEAGKEPTAFGGCFYGKAATPADFGSTSKLSWVIVTALDSAAAEVYNAWFVTGTNNSKLVCTSTKGDSKAANGPTETTDEKLTQEQVNACAKVLVDYKAKMKWACTEQH